MDSEKLNTALYEKMFAEQEKYRDWLLTQPPKEILHHTYEYTVREDILMAVEMNDLSAERASALLSSPSPLADIFKDFEKIETGYMDIVRDCIENRADDILKKQHELRDTPLYMQTAAYARENGESALFRASHNANIACKEAMEKSISEHYDYASSHLDTMGIFEEMKAQFGEDRIKYVLAATVQVHDWDGRYSSANKAWAKTIPIVDGNTAWGNRNTDFTLNTAHPVLIDGLITRVRKELDKEKEQPEKKPSVLDKLQKAAEKPHISTTSKKQDMEL